MRFEAPSPDDGARSKPVNYFNRRVQYRLLWMVTLFMLVVLAMDKVRDPRMWAWMWALEQRGDASSAPAAPAPDERVNPMLPPPAATPNSAIPDAIQTQSSGADPTAGTTAGTTAAPSPPDRDSLNAEQRVDQDLWAHVLTQIDKSQQALLDQTLKNAREQRRLPADQQGAWGEATAAIYAAGREHLEQALRATRDSALPASEKQRWVALLDQQIARWETPLREALQSPLEDRVATAPELAALAGIQETLDRIAIGQIQDNTVMRSRETRAWFRFFERLEQRSTEELAQEAARVGYVELFRQPQSFRGQLVKVHGFAEMGYRVKAPVNNILNLEHYYVLWVRPARGPNLPLVVYCLELPDGFPEIPDRSAGRADIKEEIDVSGFFFKNWAYHAKDGINTAPLLLARSPQWTPESELLSGHSQDPPWLVVLCVGLVAMLAVAIAALVYRSSLGDAPHRPSSTRPKVHNP